MQYRTDCSRRFSLRTSLSFSSRLEIMIMALKFHREPSTLVFLVHIFSIRALHFTSPSPCSLSTRSQSARNALTRTHDLSHDVEFPTISQYMSHIFPEIYNQPSYPVLLSPFLSFSRLLSSHENNLAGRRRLDQQLRDSLRI